MTIVTLYLPIFIMLIVHNRLDIVDQKCKLHSCIVRAILWQPISLTQNYRPLVPRAQLQGICSLTDKVLIIWIIHYCSLLSFDGFLDNAAHMMLLDARSELSIPASRSLFAPLPLPTVARAPSQGLPNPLGHQRHPTTLSQSGFTE